MKLQNLGDKNNEVTRENKLITFKKQQLDRKELFHFHQQIPQDNGVIIPEWYIHTQDFIERTKDLFPSVETKDLVHFDHCSTASV